MNKILLLLTMVVFSSSVLGKESRLQDPTKPLPNAMPKAGKKVVTTFRLSEIRIGNDERQAVINGKRLKKGSRIAGYRIKKIEVGYVILVNDKGTIRLNLIGNRIIRKKL